MKYMLTNSAAGPLKQEDCDFTGNLSPGEKNETLEKEGKREKILCRVPCTVHLR